MIDNNKIVDILRTVMDPVTGQDIVSMKMVEGLSINGDVVNFSINVPNLDANIKGDFTLRVYALNGNIVYQSKGNNSNTIRIVTSDWKPGNYFVEILGNNSRSSSKIIVQH